MSAKIREAEENIKQAEKYLKTSMFKWNPDYDSAADAYSRAATAYKVGGKKEEALKCLDKACDNYKEIRSLFQAGRMLDQAVLLSRDLNRMDDVVQYAERGALLLRQDGSNESAAQLLEKAAKIVEGSNPEKAIGIYTKAAETVGVEDRPREAADFISRAARLQVCFLAMNYRIFLLVMKYCCNIYAFSKRFIRIPFFPVQVLKVRLTPLDIIFLCWEAL